MKARLAIALAICALFTSVLPVAQADTDPRVQHALNAINRFPPGAAGEERHVTLIYGPYVVPAGQDNNRITLDVPIQTGFYRSVFPNLVDVKTGEEPTEQTAHIHHAHWFRATSGSDYEYYTSLGGAQGLSWVFGTGEERTGGLLSDRESPTEGYKYGIYLDGQTPQALIFMIHNKTAAPLAAYITLDIDMVYGTRQEIKAATGTDIHPLRGVLTGTTQDVFPDKVVNSASKNGVLIRDYTANFSGTIIASGSHMHPGGKWVYVTNLGPSIGGKPVCADIDVDNDGLPGTTLILSKKFDHIGGSWPYSEDYQMGGTQGGFRAPIHKGDVIRQYGVYDVKRTNTTGLNGLEANLIRSTPEDATSAPSMESIDGKPHAWYTAMSYTGIYADPDNKPALADGITSAAQCTAANFAPHLLPDAKGFKASNHIALPGDQPWSNTPTETHITHPWLHSDPVCGTPDTTVGHEGTFSCDSTGVGGTRVVDPIDYRDGEVTDTVQAAGFVYFPGDLHALRNVDGSLTVPLVTKGTTLRLINSDIAIGVRHTFTSCEMPCDGPYMANYPLPDGTFDSGKLGNIDYLDGGITGSDTVPIRSIDTSNLTANKYYSYYCSIHPTMRGMFKVI